MSAIKSNILDDLNEEYYQISPDILSSFPKFRPPLNLYRLNEDTLQILLYKKQGERMDKEVQDELAGLCSDGNIFVARSDHKIYSKHISKQLDLVLVDENLKEGEIAEVFRYALTERLELFFEQPVKAIWDLLYKDLMVLTEYLWNDKNRVKALVRRMYTEHSLANHSFNTGVLGLWLFNKVFPGSFNRRVYDKVTIGLFLHDLGMCKIPAFIRDKAKPLTNDERTKVNMHPLAGSKITLKLGLKFDELQFCIMQHHERLDGSGYPTKLSGEGVTPLGRITAVADSYSAMIAKRPYAEAKEPEQAVTELLADARRYDKKYVSHLQGAVVNGNW